MKLHFLALGLVLTLASYAPAQSLATESTSKVSPAKTIFWKSYRNAFIRKDLTKLSGLTRFPLEVKGTLDGDPVFKVNSEKFRSCFPIVFNRDVGLFAQEQSHLAFIKATSTPPGVQKGNSEDLFRVADLEFGKFNGTFRLERIYLDTSNPNIRKQCEGP